MKTKNPQLSGWWRELSRLIIHRFFVDEFYRKRGSQEDIWHGVYAYVCDRESKRERGFLS